MGPFSVQTRVEGRRGTAAAHDAGAETLGTFMLAGRGCDDAVIEAEQEAEDEPAPPLHYSMHNAIPDSDPVALDTRKFRQSRQR